MPRPLESLPKAHLHLHFTGSMRPETLRDLAVEQRMRLPRALDDGGLPQLQDVDERGWFRFQRLYDAARACVRSPEAMRRIVREAAHDDAAEGSRWLELQVDPTSYAPFCGGLSPALELVLDAAREAASEAGIGVGIVVAASRIRHPLDARTLARLAARHAGDSSGTVVGFGLSNDEHRGATAEFGAAFGIARAAGLALVPHGGELRGPEAVTQTLDTLLPDRIGHGVRAAEDPRVMERLAREGVALEVCPGSNVSLGVYDRDQDVPLRTLLEAGVQVTLAADDPLLFGSRLVAQYETARTVHGLDDEELAQIARSSLRASTAPRDLVAEAECGIDAWLALPA